MSHFKNNKGHQDKNKFMQHNCCLNVLSSTDYS